MEAPTQERITAPYGKACTSCAKARCKCILRQGIGSPCERCLRLRRECVPSVSVRKRGPKAANKSAQLQQKLDDLLALMKKQAPAESQGEQHVNHYGASNAVQPTPASLVNTPVTASSAAPSPESIATIAATYPDQQDAEQHEYRANLQAGCNFPSGIPYYTPTLPSSSVEIAPEEAEQNLSVFRDQMLYYLPFVYIPPRMTARRLCQDMPFLWFSIMAITTRSVRDQVRMGSAIRRHVAQKMVVENQTSMDLLLGLLVFLGWSHFHRRERSHMSLMSSLAVSLVYDLFLLKKADESTVAPYSRDMATVQAPPRPLDTVSPAAPASSTALLQPSKQRTMETRRALLACFYHTSVISHTAKKTKPLTWTAVMDDDMKVLSEQPECSGDSVLAALVKIQLVVDKLARLSWSPQEAPSSTLYSDSLRSSLQAIKADLDPKLASHETLSNALIEAELIIHETILLNTPVSPQSPDLARHMRLQDTLASIAAGLDAFFAMSPWRYGGVTFALWDQVRHRFALLLHLVAREHVNWQAAVVSCRAAGLDLEAVCGRLAAAEDAFLRLGNNDSNSGTNEREEDALFFRVRLFLESMRNGCAAGMAAAGGPTESSIQSGSGFAASADGSTISTFQVDDLWMTDIFHMPWDWGSG